LCPVLAWQRDDWTLVRKLRFDGSLSGPVLLGKGDGGMEDLARLYVIV
jgi:hypothetical protein